MAKPVLKTLLILTLLLNGAFAGAKSAGWRTSLNNLQESLGQLVIIKSSDRLPSEERVAVDIEARKTAFNRVLDLAAEELTDLKKKLEKLTHPDRLKHLDTITEYQSYYEIIRGQINKEINLEEVVDIATKFKKWRETTYNRGAIKIIDFILVFQNQEAIKVAENRLDRIMRDFKVIKSYLMPNEWSLAEKLVDDARNLINEAKKGEVPVVTQKITAAYKNFITLSEMVR